MLNVFPLILALQQHVPMATGNTSPPSGDTAGYWQQRIAYTIVATLDESAQRVRSTGTLRYVNNSPDTLREMYVHQYLNAFRPGSKWSEIDEREGRVRFQHLRDPDYGFERFTAPPRVGGVAVTVDYPGAPDSTVAHFRLPAALAPGDSVRVELAWDARPATVPRRQGRRGRQWDMAQWYPKVAVYDRAGWETNALQPAGEFFGEFGTYDVTIILPDDQVIGATGVPVSGDPGWKGALRNGEARTASNAYGSLPAPPTVIIPDRYKAVRFFARNVHHFAWSTFPNYRYEGGAYTRALPRGVANAWDTVSIHALYRAGDDTTWGGMRAVTRTANALHWLESIYGPYAYPQMTVLHRLDGGGTEFPMMQMNGSASQGLILHEGGHNFTYGILANNEWRSGWMDEGLTSYQTDWAEQNTAQELARNGFTGQQAPAQGYRSLGIRMALTPSEALDLSEALTDIQGNAQPIGTPAQDFRDFSIYNDMIYNRAEVMYGQLRDVLGDSAFAAFLHDYYSRWELKHVDERAMRASAERVSGKALDWFFEQWVHRTGVTDYSLVTTRRTRAADGRWTTEAEVLRRGSYRHPIDVGVRTTSGWTIAQAGDPLADRQTVRITTSDEPIDVRLDPLHFSWDWNRLDDRADHSGFAQLRRSHGGVDWPFLDQADRDHHVSLWLPMAWYSDNGGANLGLRWRGSYLSTLDQGEAGLVQTVRGPWQEGLQAWARFRNPMFSDKPAMGWAGGVARLDDIGFYQLGWESSRASLRGSQAFDLQATYANTSRDDSLLVPEFWTASHTFDVSASAAWKIGPPSRGHFFVRPSLLVGRSDVDTYGKGELELGRVQPLGSRTRFGLRLYAADEENVPGQRALLLSARDPVATFWNHWWRPEGAILKRPGVDWLPLGGAALRGYTWELFAHNVAAANGDLSRQIASFTAARGRDASLAIRLHAFGDVASVSTAGVERSLGDAGVGLSISGRLYDRPLFVRIDSPFYVSNPAFAIDRGHAGSDGVAPRWTITFNDAW